MNAQAWTAVIAAIALAGSWAGAAWLAGRRSGKTEERLQGKYDALAAEMRSAQQLQQATTSNELRSIAEKLARIEGLFELVPRFPAGQRQHSAHSAGGD